MLLQLVIIDRTDFQIESQMSTLLTLPLSFYFRLSVSLIKTNVQISHEATERVLGNPQFRAFQSEILPFPKGSGLCSLSFLLTPPPSVPLVRDKHSTNCYCPAKTVSFKCVCVLNILCEVQMAFSSYF